MNEIIEQDNDIAARNVLNDMSMNMRSDEDDGTIDRASLNFTANEAYLSAITPSKEGNVYNDPIANMNML